MHNTTLTVIEPVIQGQHAVSKDIYDYGMAFVTSAFFLVLMMILIISAVLWVKSLIIKLINHFTDDMKMLLEENHKQTETLVDLAEGLRTETQLRIRNLSGFAFDLAMEQVSRLIKKCREENHIDDHEAEAKKVRLLLQTIHDDRNSRFDPFTFRGRRLSEYCKQQWVEDAAQLVESELYHVDGPNNARAWSNIQALYSKIKTEFYQSLNG